MTVGLLREPVRSSAGPASGCVPGALDEFWFLRWVVRLRWVFFGIAVALILLGHNGRWRIGRDSALYRDVARNLAEGRGYTYRGEPERHIYPGLPLLLAGVQKVFGREDPLRPAVSLYLMLGIALATLLCVYKLVGQHFPKWVAVCVTTGLGINYEFTQHAHELMTDMPFLLGACMALLGLGRLRRGQPTGRRAAALALLAGGAILTALMRPTFWVLVATALLVAVIELVRSRRWKLPLLAIGACVVFVIVWMAVDPRGGPLQGKYEQSVRQHLKELFDTQWDERMVKLVAVHLPEAVLGFELPTWLGIAFTGLMMGASVRRIRYLPAWGVYVLVTFGMLVIVGSNTRYLLMVVPLLLVEWALIIHALARWLIPLIPWRFTPDWTMLIGLGLATVIHVGLSGNLVLEQHGYDRNHHFHRRAFLDVYRGGKMKPVAELGAAIRKHVPQGQRVLGPEARITTFLSGRYVYDASDVFGERAGRTWAAAFRRRHIGWVAWGPQFVKEWPTVMAIRARVILIQYGHWWTVVPQGRGASGKMAGVYLGKVWVEAPTTLPRGVPRYHLGQPRPNSVRMLPGLYLPARRSGGPVMTAPLMPQRPGADLDAWLRRQKLHRPGTPVTRPARRNRTTRPTRPPARNGAVDPARR